MKVLAFLIRTNVRKSVVIALLSALSGLGSAGLIATVTTALQHGGSALVRPSYLIALAFVAALAAKIGANLASNLMMGRFAQQSILDLCTGLCRKVIQAPLREIEVMGSATILTCLTEDVNVLTNSVQAIPLVLTNAVVLLGCAVYLAWMSWIAVVLLTLMMVIAGVCYRLLMRSAYPPIQRARLGKEKLFRHFRSLTDGIKELKIHRDRNEMFFREDIEAAAEHFRNENVVAMIRYARADAWSQMMFGLLLATLLFALPTTSWMTPDAITKYVFVTIYVMSPAWNLIRALPTFASGQVSLERMEELGLALDNVAPRVSGSIDLRDARRAATVTRSTPPLVEFRNVVFSYSGRNAF